MDQLNSSVMNSGLDILANIASTALQTDFPSQYEQRIPTVKIKRPRKIGARRRLTDLDSFDASQLIGLANQTLVRLFAECESDEIKKHFKFVCKLMPDSCEYESQSFGSEVYAKTTMRKHLVNHIQDMKDNPEAFKNFVTESTFAKRRRMNKENLSLNANKSEKKPIIKQEQVVFKDDEDHNYCVNSESANTKPNIKDEIEENMDKVDDSEHFQTDEWIESIQRAKLSDGVESMNAVTVYLPDIGSEVQIDTNVCKSRRKKFDKSSTTPEILSPEVLKERELAAEAIKELQSRGSQGNSDFQCKVCGKKLTAYGTLLSHLRSHAGHKPYICELCNDEFTRQHSLNYHLLLHKNETRFECDFCGKKFRHPSHYKDHLKRHEGRMPYNCDECHIEYKTFHTYKRHLKYMHEKTLRSPPSKELPKEDKIVNEKSKVPEVAFNDHDDEVAKISQSYEEMEALLNRKVVLRAESGNSEESYYPSTGSEFSTPDPVDAPKGDSPNSLLEFGSVPPSQIQNPKSLKNDANLEESTKYRHLLRNTEKSPNLLQNTSNSAFDPFKATSQNLEETSPSQQVKKELPDLEQNWSREILPPYKLKKKMETSNSSEHVQPLLANLNGQQVVLIPKTGPTEPIGSQSKLEQCLRYGSAAAMNASSTANNVVTTSGDVEQPSVVYGQTFVLSQPISLSASQVNSIRLVPVTSQSSLDNIYAGDQYDLSRVNLGINNVLSTPVPTILPTS